MKVFLDRLLLRMVGDKHGLKLEKVGPTLQKSPKHMLRLMTNFV